MKKLKRIWRLLFPVKTVSLREAVDALNARTGNEYCAMTALITRREWKGEVSYILDLGGYIDGGT